MRKLQRFLKTSLSLAFAVLMAQSAWANKPGVDNIGHPTLSVDYAPDDLERERILALANESLLLPKIAISDFVSPYSEGGVHDFYSNGDYWWPNPQTPSGLPFVQRDGQSNPHNFNAHRMVIRRLVDAIGSLAMAQMLTADDRYATKAQELLVVFFLDPETRMNPRLDFAQAIPGITPGRGVGIIDTLHLIDVPMAIMALEKNRVFSQTTAQGLREWFKAYLHWMLTSKNGHDESFAKNNHSVAFWLKVAAFAKFTGDHQALDLARETFKKSFVAQQMASDGSFPLELARTKPYGYSIFQLDNMAALCQILSTPTDSLWTYQTPEGKGMQRAIAFMSQYIEDKKSWPQAPDIEAFDGWPVRQPFLIFAALAYQDPHLMALWKNQVLAIKNEEVRRNVAITQPWLWLH